jgi:hypothetical protein
VTDLAPDNAKDPLIAPGWQNRACLMGKKSIVRDFAGSVLTPFHGSESPYSESEKVLATSQPNPPPAEPASLSFLQQTILTRPT